jgi:hypothetical protein
MDNYSESPEKSIQDEMTEMNVRQPHKTRINFLVQMQSWVVVGEVESPKSAKQSHYGTKKNAQISLEGRISRVGQVKATHEMSG